MEVRKGCTIEQFLSFVKVQLGDDFPELRNISPGDMLYVKEDMIIPHVCCSSYHLSLTCLGSTTAHLLL
jgi:hypothetical protein